MVVVGSIDTVSNMQQQDRLWPRLQGIVVMLLRASAVSAMHANAPLSSYNLRRYEPTDRAAIIAIFCANISEEWGELHHDGKYLPNAERYVRSVVHNDASDLNNVDEVYFAKGGHFWTLSHATQEGDCAAEVVGMCGLEVNSRTEVVLRRMCISRNHRRNGCGSNIMIPAILEKATAINGMKRITLSTPEHGADVIRFYKTNGFVNMLDAEGNPKRILNIHGTPIHEACLEMSLRPD